MKLPPCKGDKELLAEALVEKYGGREVNACVSHHFSYVCSIT
jgi:hypothetical protein